MAAAIKAINAKIRSNKVLDYVCSTREFARRPRLFPAKIDLISWDGYDKGGDKRIMYNAVTRRTKRKKEPKANSNFACSQISGALPPTSVSPSPP